MKKYFQLMRIHHYIKNVLIILPLFFSKNLLNLKMWKKTMTGGAAFCLAASVIYIINDLWDVEKDKNHPTKCHRPIASGSILPRRACFLAFFLALGSIIGTRLASDSYKTWFFLFLYIILNLGYSCLHWKDIPIIDIGILMMGFLLRILFGASLTGIEVSHWLYLTMISASFWMGLGKRRNECQKNADSSRKVLQFYTFDFLDKNMNTCLALTIVFYSLWSVDSSVKAWAGTDVNGR